MGDSAPAYEPIDMAHILFRGSEHKSSENVLDWEINVPDRPTGGLYSHPSLKIYILYHIISEIGISGPGFEFALDIFWKVLSVNIVIFGALISQTRVKCKRESRGL